MNKIHLQDLAEEHWASPKGKIEAYGRGVTLALGLDDRATDLRKRGPFDVEVVRVRPGKAICPYHSHSAQWEYYQVLSGRGAVRHAGGTAPIEEGDCFLFPPDEPHQILNDQDPAAPAAGDLVVLVVADNPIGESCHYPDSGKWLVRSPERRLIRSAPLDYNDGEE